MLFMNMKSFGVSLILLLSSYNMKFWC